MEKFYQTVRKEIVKAFRDGKHYTDGKMYKNVVNGGRAIKQRGDGYYFFCDGVDEDALAEYCEEFDIDYTLYVVKSRKMNVFGTKERVIVEIW